MIARDYDSSDAPALDVLFNGNRGHCVRLESDRIICAGTPAVGALVWTPSAFVHELHTGHSLAQRYVADLLVGAAIRECLEREFRIREAIFLTDSDRMAEYAIERGAVEQFGKRTFTLRLP